MKTIIIALIVVVLAGLAWFYFRKPAVEVNNSETMDHNQMTDKKNIDAMKEENSAGVVSSSKEITYFTNPGGKKFTGFLAEPSAPGTYPGVVMIHEWWGLNQEIKDAAQELASQGYRVFAVDLYGHAAVATADEAQALVAKVNPVETTANMQAAVKYLRDSGSAKIASLGWCFGGGKSLELGLSGEKLNAIVLYYGTPLVTDKNELAKLPAPVLGIFGDKDTAIPVSTVKDFESGLIMSDIKNEIEIYPGVGHAFANPSGANYAPKATADAWAKTLAFLKTNLK